MNGRYYVRSGAYELPDMLAVRGAVRFQGQPPQRWKRAWFRVLVALHVYRWWPE